MIAIFKRLLEQWNVRQKALELQQKLIDADIETEGKLARHTYIGSAVDQIPGVCVFFAVEHDNQDGETYRWDFLAHVPDDESHEIELRRYRKPLGAKLNPDAYTSDGEPSFQTIDHAVDYIKDNLADS